MYFEFVGTNVRLLGTIHRFPGDAPDPPQWLIAAREWAEDIVLEADHTEMSNYFRAAPGHHLKSVISKRVWRELDAVWPSDMELGSMKPWAAAMITPGIVSAPSVDGADVFLRASGKPVSYLESVQEHVDIFETMPRPVVLRTLRALVSDLDAPRRLLLGMHEAWLRKDTLETWRIAESSPGWEIEEFRRPVIEDRNKKWRKPITDLFSTTRRTLVAVGALHLCGPESVQAIIGATYEPVS